jgi:hypothetical protein
MHTAQGRTFVVVRMRGLDDRHIEAVCGEFVAAGGSRKIASFILDPLGLDQRHTDKFCG